MAIDVREDLAAFVSAAPELRKVVLTLAAAESLTDDTARLLIKSAAPEMEADRIIRALHVCDFVLERNSEWQFARDVREVLLPELGEHTDLSYAAHTLLLQLADR